MSATTSWASEAEYETWFRAQVLSGRIDWPAIAFNRSFTLVSDENGRRVAVTKTR